MPEFADSPVWVWSIVAVAAIGIGVGLWFLGRFLWLRILKRYLVTLIGKAENARASHRTLEAVMRHLVDGSDEALAVFASDPEAADRMALLEVRGQMKMLTEELDTMRVPAALMAVAEEFGDAAFVISEEAGRVNRKMTADEVLASLARVDLERAAMQIEKADALLADVCELYGVKDAAVYGGGLYI